jgi:dephospho-CoA kinase
VTKLIALTGSIGGGKSAVAELLRARGATIIDADLLARQVLTPGTEGYHETIDLFGSDIVREDNTIDRGKVANQIFRDPALRIKLEAILHPRIRAAFQQRLSELRDTSAQSSSSPSPGTFPPSVIVYVVPLLFEAHADLSPFDEIVVVAVTPPVAISRAASRDGASREDIQRRYEAQMPIEEKVARASIVIDNNGTREELAAEVARVWEQLMK